MSVLVKQSAVIVFSGVVMLFFVARLVHRRRLTFGFASGWVAVSIAVIASSLLTPLVNPIARQFSMTGTAVFLLVAVAFIVAVCIQLSISVSGLQERIRDLAEANALLRAELERRDDDAGTG
jgi:ABC-type Fe3+ transport system permease subunit